MVAPAPFKITKEVVLQKITSRKFLLAFFAGLFIVLTEGLGLEIDVAVYDYIAKLVMAYICGEGLVDAARILKMRQ